MDNIRQEELPQKLKDKILTAHYDALASAYKSDVRRRVNHMLRAESGGKLPLTVVASMGAHIANMLEEAIAASAHNKVQEVIEKAL